jgi:hypothetical protein
MKTMNKLFIFILFSGFSLLVSCEKGNIPSNGNEIIVPPGDSMQPEILYTGTLIGGEAGDEARGDVTIKKLGTKYYLQFKNFTSNDGPDVHVYFSKTIGTHAVPPLEYQDLGFLKYTSGNFNYELAGAPDVANYKYVLIWCARFRIQFGYTELK